MSSRQHGLLPAMLIETDMDETESAAPLLEVISRHWGYDSFRPLQREAMTAVLEKRDSVVVMPTGGGKSLCYQAPALLQKGLTVVVSPLISLMKDQVDGLVACGVAAAQLNSALDLIDQRLIEEEVRGGKIKLLFVSPERLAVASFRKLLSSVRVEAFAIDEAHCISHWGHDFRPEYRQLRDLRSQFPDASLHAYTATATERVRDDIAQQLSLQKPELLVGSFDRPNLTYRVVPRVDELLQIEEVLSRHKGEAGIIYCIRRRDVDDLTTSLQRRGYRAVAYHAGLSPADRHAAQEAFSSEECDIVVATVAFGMGIDRSNVRFVLHAGMPKSVEHYQQESGRAGRDGLEAECVLLYSPADVSLWKMILENATATIDPDDAKPKHLQTTFRQLERMRDYCGGGTCRHRALVEYFGQSYEGDDCKACDLCLNELGEIDDSTTVAMKILSCVVRLRDPFGTAYLGSVLRGENIAKIRERNHDQLSTFGILSEHSKNDIRDWIGQLISQRLLLQEGDRYPVVRLTAAAREVLKGEAKVRLTRHASATKVSDEEGAWSGVDRPLFVLLRDWRKRVADLRGVPPFVVFSDATLRQIAAVRPSTLERLRSVYGIGEAKIAEFGAAVMEVVDAHCAESGASRDEGAPPPVSTTRAEKPIKHTAMLENVFDAFRRGASISEVVAMTGRAAGTVSGYLEQFLQKERPSSIEPWVSADSYAKIIEAADQVGRERLRPIRDALGESVTYEEIRVALAHERVMSASK